MLLILLDTVLTITVFETLKKNFLDVLDFVSVIRNADLRVCRRMHMTLRVCAALQ